MFNKAGMSYIVKAKSTVDVYNDIIKYGTFCDEKRLFFSLSQETAKGILCHLYQSLHFE